ncbi:hypothetical protein MMC2321_03787 [Chitinophaga sp. MM2321]
MKGEIYILALIIPNTSQITHAGLPAYFYDM